MKINNFQHEGGYCWIARLPKPIATGDSMKKPLASQLRVFEDETELGPKCSPHDEIRRRGAGAFSHWAEDLYFSASDNSDPRHNGKTYIVVAPAAEEVRGFGDETAGNSPYVQKPVNYGPLTFTQDSIGADLDYAIGIANTYANSFDGGKRFLSGRTVLEIGPGTNFGAALALKCWGAKEVAVADRFLVNFQSDYHIPLYKELAKRLKANDSAVDVSPILNCIAKKQHASDSILCIEAPLEKLSDHFNNYFDITLSNAVFEHLYDPLAGLKSLYAITALPGIGYHQVDFRDHRDFSRPLEYLLLDELSFARLLQENHAECGNRLRPHQMESMLSSTGFQIIEYQSNMTADAGYLDAFVPRLRTSPLTLFMNMDERYLVSISGRFVICRQG